MKLLGFLISFIGLTLVLLITCEWNANDAAVFLDSVSLIGIAFPVVGVVIGTRNFKTLISGINGALSEKYRMTEEQRGKTIALFNLLKSTVLYAVALTVAMAFVLLLLNLDDPSTFGPKVGVALLTIVQGTFINMVLLNPAVCLLQQKQTDESFAGDELITRTRVQRIPSTIRDKEAAAKLLQLCHEKGITHEEIMEADEITLKRRQ